jgi:hypothetical protein
MVSEPRKLAVIVVRVESDAGAVGYGVAEPQAHSSVVDLLNREIAPFVAGRDPLLAEQIVQSAWLGAAALGHAVRTYRVRTRCMRTGTTTNSRPGHSPAYKPVLSVGTYTATSTPMPVSSSPMPAIHARRAGYTTIRIPTIISNTATTVATTGLARARSVKLSNFVGSF